VMLVGGLLRLVAQLGAELRQGEGEDSLQFGPPGMLPPALVAELKEHKTEILQILREDEEMCRTGIIQSERQVFELAREQFGLDGKKAAS
jgi:hypothetical protein